MTLLPTSDRVRAATVVANQLVKLVLIGSP